MKVFFIAAIQGKDNYEDNYKFIVDKIEDLGHTVVFDDYLFDVSNDDLSKMDGSKELFAMHQKIIDGIKKSDIVVAELSEQRISLGYFISLALDLSKPTIALYKGNEKSHLLSTLELDEKFVSFGYTSNEDIDKELPILLEFSSEQQDTRFNFFISPKHQNFLDWVSKTKKIPRSVYLRKLIEEQMLKEVDYK